MPERNPYLIIGVDFAASRDDARHAFARAARRTRREGGIWTIEDLNWALHEIEALEQNPSELVDHYRVPADPSVFDPAGEGLFRPAPVPLERRTDENDEEALGQTRAAALGELEDLLLTAIGGLVVTPDAGYELEAQS